MNDCAAYMAKITEVDQCVVYIVRINDTAVFTAENNGCVTVYTLVSAAE